MELIAQQRLDVLGKGESVFREIDVFCRSASAERVRNVVPICVEIEFFVVRLAQSLAFEDYNLVNLCEGYASGILFCPSVALQQPTIALHIIDTQACGVH